MTSPSSRSDPVLGRSIGLLAAWAFVDAAIAIYLMADGVGTASRLSLLTGVIGFGVFTIGRWNRGVRSGVNLQVASILVVAAHATIFLALPFRAELPPPTDLFRVVPASALIALAVGGAVSKGRVEERSMTAALIVVALLGLLYRAAIVATDMAPPFDVPDIQVAAGQAVLSGSDPYLTTVYHSGYPYLPMAAIAAAIGELAGDARWASVAGDGVIMLALLLFARRIGVSIRVGVALAAVWAWWAGGFYVTWQGFPEPILIGFTALAAAALAGDSPRTALAGALVGLAAATKQFGLGCCRSCHGARNVAGDRPPSAW